MFNGGDFYVYDKNSNYMINLYIIVFIVVQGLSGMFDVLNKLSNVLFIVMFNYDVSSVWFDVLQVNVMQVLGISYMVVLFGVVQCVQGVFDQFNVQFVGVGMVVLVVSDFVVGVVSLQYVMSMVVLQSLLQSLFGQLYVVSVVMIFEVIDVGMCVLFDYVDQLFDGL